MNDISKYTTENTNYSYRRFIVVIRIINSWWAVDHSWLSEREYFYRYVRLKKKIISRFLLDF